MREKLTDVFIKSLVAPHEPDCAVRNRPNERCNCRGRIEVVDTKSSGLALRVTSKGAKSWCLRFRDPHSGKTSRATIGTYPDVSLGDARDRADDMRRRIAAGNNPVEPQAETVSVILDRFVTEYVRNAGHPLRSGDVIEGTFDRLVKPCIGQIKIRLLRRSHVNSMLDKIAADRGPVMADRTLAYLRKALNWYAAKNDEFNSPIAHGMARTKPRERERERTLVDDEIRAVWSTAEATGSVFGRYVQFLLLTAVRRTEGARMKRSEVSNGEWIIPAARMKGKREHLVPFSPSAKAILDRVPKRGEFVFTTDGANPISGFNKLKRTFDAAVLRRLREDDARAKPLPNWTLHDLRRTARSLMSRAGVSTDIAERCLAHVIGGVRGVYDRHAYAAEKRDAFEKLGAMIESIVVP
jgi:integrase